MTGLRPGVTRRGPTVCNAFNHSLRCTCGFGGIGHRGRGRGRWGRFGKVRRTVWARDGEDFCRPSRCPRCHAEVFFVRHNGGSAWFDALGVPWPKHGCFDEEPQAAELRQVLTAEHLGGREALFGVVIGTETAERALMPQFSIRWASGTLTTEEKMESRAAESYLGRLVIAVRDKHGGICWEFFEPEAPPEPPPEPPEPPPEPPPDSAAQSLWEPMYLYAMKPGFPFNAQGRNVRLHGKVGRIVKVTENGRKFLFRVSSTAAVKRYQTSVVVQEAANDARRRADGGS